jgi:hypothetical protein
MLAGGGEERALDERLGLKWSGCRIALIFEVGFFGGGAGALPNLRSTDIWPDDEAIEVAWGGREKPDESNNSNALKGGFPHFSAPPTFLPFHFLFSLHARTTTK